MDFFSRLCDGIQFNAVIGTQVQHNFPMHIHKTICIGLVIKGERIMHWDKVTETVSAGDIFIINAKEPHAIEAKNPHDYLAITISGLPEQYFFKHIIKSEDVTSKFLLFFRSMAKDDTLKMADKWNAFYMYIQQNYVVERPDTEIKPQIQKALQFIEEHYQEQISVDEIAENSYMSTYHFCRQFKAETGFSPHKYLMQYRLMHSYRKLRQNESVFDAAINTGFYDSSHFIHAFMQFMATSPMQYQKSLLDRE